jgi:hypothetical protein
MKQIVSPKFYLSLHVMIVAPIVMHEHIDWQNDELQYVHYE